MNKTTTLTALLSITILTSVIAISDISPAFADNPTLNPQNGHYYQYIPAPGITWTEAKTAAENSTYNGASGYLVTVEYVLENDFIAHLVPNDSRSWIGYSDEVTEGDYKWVTGELFWFTNWSYGQPDNAGGNEHYVEFLGSNGKWNDLPNNNNYITGYVVEYNIPKLNPENGHYYDYIFDRGISWTDAKNAAENSAYNGLHGHLVTITSESEDDFVAGFVIFARAWIGLSDESTEGTYEWVTGETFDYSNWYTDRPDNAGGNEHYVEFLGLDVKWNDLPNSYENITGYVIEYEPSVDDPALNPENGHYYEYIIGHEITWDDAKEAAENSTYNGLHGHLVTITSQSENDFVANLSQDDFRPWIGLSDESTEGTYTWVTGEPFSYANWSPGEPSYYPNEDYVEFFASNDKWNDNTNNNHYITGYIIEYSD